MHRPRTEFGGCRIVGVLQEDKVPDPDIVTTRDELQHRFRERIDPARSEVPKIAEAHDHIGRENAR